LFVDIKVRRLNILILAELIDEVLEVGLGAIEGVVSVAAESGIPNCGIRSNNGFEEGSGFRVGFAALSFGQVDVEETRLLIDLLSVN
jgi:hypothetical protein